ELVGAAQVLVDPAAPEEVQPQRGTACSIAKVTGAPEHLVRAFPVLRHAPALLVAESEADAGRREIERAALLEQSIRVPPVAEDPLAFRVAVTERVTAGAVFHVASRLEKRVCPRQILRQPGAIPQTPAQAGATARVAQLARPRAQFVGALH